MGSSQEHLVRCIDFAKTVMSVLVSETWRNMIYGILRAVMRLSATAAPVSEGRLLSASLSPIILGCQCLVVFVLLHCM